MKVHITSCVLTLLTAQVYCLAQANAGGEKSSTELQDTIRRLSEKYGIAGVTKPYQDSGQRVISDIRPILRWIDEEYGGRDWTVSASASQFHKSFRVTSGDSKRHDSLEIRLQIAGSFEGAERLAALSIGTIVLEKNHRMGAFFAAPVGDWSYSGYFEDILATLRFLRRNVVVWMAYSSAIEALPGKKERSIPDPSIGAKCEAIAREIDRRIILLPPE